MTETTIRVPAPPRRRDKTGRFLPTFTLSYTTSEGRMVRPGLAADGVELVGRLVSGMADEEKAWDIEVLDRGKADVTQEFACFQD